MLVHLFGIIAGFCTIYLFKLRRLREAINKGELDRDSEWVTLEIKSIYIFLGIGVLVICLAILVDI